MEQAGSSESTKTCMRNYVCVYVSLCMYVYIYVYIQSAPGLIMIKTSTMPPVRWGLWLLACGGGGRGGGGRGREGVGQNLGGIFFQDRDL